MDAIRDLFQSLTGYLRDRLSNPFYGAFLIAWGVANFRLVLVLIGDGSTQSKIAFIDGQLYVSAYQWLERGLLVPGAIAIGFVMISPFIQRWVTVFLQKRYTVTQARLLEIANETPLSSEAAARLRAQYLSERQRRMEESRDSAQRIDELTAQVELLLTENRKLKVNTQKSQEDALLEGKIPELQEHPGDLGIDVNADNPIAQNRDPLVLKSADFSSLPKDVDKFLSRRPLTPTEGRVLYELRNDEGTSIHELVSRVDGSERFAIQIALDHLEALKFATQAGNGDWYLTPHGRQALAAILGRGFVPKDDLPF